MQKKNLPESASLDHTKVKAPYIRLAGVMKTKRGDKIYKYDVRFTQPNKTFVSNPVLHTLEHLLAVHLRSYLTYFVDISPMGCQTGFYLLALNPYDEVVEAFAKALKDLLKDETVPFANVVQCGRAKSHDLAGAKKYAKMMLKGKKNWTTGWQVYEG